MTSDPFTYNNAAFDTSLLQSCGDDVFVSERVEIRRPSLITLGSHIAIDSGFYITTAATIGHYVHIGPFVCVIGGARGMVSLGHFTTVGAHSTIICVSDSFNGKGLVSAPGIDTSQTDLIVKSVVLEDFSNIGAHVTVLPGVVIREGSVVGAGSVVTKDTQPWTINVGSPAKPIKERPKEIMLAHAASLGYPFRNLS